MVKWQQTCTRWAVWPMTLVKQYRSGSKVLSLLLSCFTKIRIILSIVCPSVRPSLRRALLLLAPQRDKWHLNNNNIEFYWSHFVHLSLNNTCIYWDLKSSYDQNYMLNKKSSVWQNFVRSDKISSSVRPMSDKTLEYFDSTVLVHDFSVLNQVDSVVRMLNNT